MKLETRKLGAHWWITGDEEEGPYGPYDSKTEADEDRVGINQTSRHWDDREFWTTDKEGLSYESKMACENVSNQGTMPASDSS